MTHQKRCILRHTTRAKRISYRSRLQPEGLGRALLFALLQPFNPIQRGISYVNSNSDTTDARAGNSDIGSGWYCVNPARTDSDRGGRLWPERIGTYRSATCHLYQQ